MQEFLPGGRIFCQVFSTRGGGNLTISNKFTGGLPGGEDVRAWN